MDTIITHNEVVALVVNPTSIAPCPNFTNLRILRCHIQRALQRLNGTQSNILGWAGLIMARPMYSLLTTSPFWLPNDLRPLTIYYQPPVEIIDEHGDPVLDAAGFPIYCLQPTIACAEQTKTTINVQFKRAKNYYESYMNIHWAVFNYLNNNIDDAFKIQGLK